MERKRTLDIIISAVIAIILWFYLINIVNPQKDAQIRYVPVSISGVEALQERGLAVAGDLNYTVNLKIIGARSDITDLTAADFTATADIASLNKGVDHIMVKVAAPRGIAIEDIDTDNIEVLVEDFVTELKPVRLHFSDEKEGTETTVLSRSDENINVSGAKSDVDKVVYMLFELPSNLLAEDIPKAVSLSGMPVDAEGVAVGGISAAKESIMVDAVIYKTKAVTVQTSITGEPMYGEASITGRDIQSVIDIKGSSKQIDELSAIKAEPISIEGIEKTTTYEIKVQLPSGIYKTRNCPELKATVFIAEDAKERYEESLISGGAISGEIESGENEETGKEE